MSTKFVLFRTAGTNEPEPILINPAHVRTVRQSGSAQVTLVMDDGEGGGYQNVEGDLNRHSPDDGPIVAESASIARL